MNVGCYLTFVRTCGNQSCGEHQSVWHVVNRNWFHCYGKTFHHQPMIRTLHGQRDFMKCQNHIFIIERGYVHCYYFFWTKFSFIPMLTNTNSSLRLLRRHNMCSLILMNTCLILNLNTRNILSFKPKEHERVLIEVNAHVHSNGHDTHLYSTILCANHYAFCILYECSWATGVCPKLRSKTEIKFQHIILWMLIFFKWHEHNNSETE